MTLDLIKRFTSTPHNGTVELNNMVVRVSTNHIPALNRLRLETSSSNATICDEPGWHWRIVVERIDCSHGPDFAMRRFSHNGLAFIQFGRHGGFLASDLRAHTGISFVAQDLIENEHLFHHYYLSALRLMLTEMELSK